IRQAFRHEKPAQAIGHHDERISPAMSIHPLPVGVRGSPGSLLSREVGHIVTDPFSPGICFSGIIAGLFPGRLFPASGVRAFSLGLPPDKLLALAPGLTLGVGAGAVVKQAAVGRPGKTPTTVIGEIRVPVPYPRRVSLAVGRPVLAIRGYKAAVDPAAAGGGAVVLQIGKA